MPPSTPSPRRLSVARSPTGTPRLAPAQYNTDGQLYGVATAVAAEYARAQVLSTEADRKLRLLRAGCPSPGTGRRPEAQRRLVEGTTDHYAETAQRAAAAAAEVHRLLPASPHRPPAVASLQPSFRTQVSSSVRAAQSPAHHADMSVELLSPSRAFARGTRLTARTVSGLDTDALELLVLPGESHWGTNGRRNGHFGDSPRVAAVQAKADYAAERVAEMLPSKAVPYKSPIIQTASEVTANRRRRAVASDTLPPSSDHAAGTSHKHTFANEYANSPRLRANVATRLSALANDKLQRHLQDHAV